MSLLLDARKKSQQALSAQAGDHSVSGRELSLEPYPGSASPATAPPALSADNNARMTGQNLFNAKSSHAPSFARAGINRNLLIALGGAVILFTVGAGYVWYVISPGNTPPPRPVSTAAAASPIAPPPQNNLVPEIISSDVASQQPSRMQKPAHAKKPSAKVVSPQTHNSLHIEQHQDEPIDPLLNSAYQAYRSGKLEQAQQLYREVLNLDSSNTDALLGLAVIAQRRGADSLAAHYYAQVMALDPRNAVANAGMSALSTDDNRESRLKTLLNEQQDSSSLHFALGNYYAAQARWGEAQQAYFNAYRLEPGNAELAFNLAISLDRLGQQTSAAQYYQRALQLDAEHHAGFDHAKIAQRIEELTH
jgi:Flp pilus assembly protein TadD